MIAISTSSSKTHLSVSQVSFVWYLLWEDLEAHSYLTDGTGPAVKTPEKDHTEIFKCLIIKVIAANEWTMNDIILNKGILVDGEREVPPEMKDLISELHNRRIFDVSHFYLNRSP